MVAETPHSRRLPTFISHHSHLLFEITQSFVDGLAGAFPPVRELLPLGTKAERYESACAIAAVLKHARDVDAVAPAIEAIGARLARRGLTAGHIPAARQALFAAIRRHTGQAWTPVIEQDWNQAIEDFTDRLNLPATRRSRVAA